MSNPGGYGRADPFNSSSEFNAMSFLVRQMMGRVRTTLMVEVQGVINSGGVLPVGFVDVKPLVNQVDGIGNSVPHETVFGLCYFRLQGGSNAIILDPQVGDIGFAVVADRDSSAVKTSKKASNPGSHRTFDLADGIYIGGILNGIPDQYVRFSGAGVVIHSPALVRLEAPDIQISSETLEIAATTSVDITSPTVTINGNLQTNGNLGVTGDASMGGGSRAVVLDGDPVTTGGTVTATSTKTRAS